MPRFHFTDPDGDPVDVPGRWVICSRCDGNGTHDHPAFSNGITSDEWAEWDHDERDAYLSGRYDVACTECKGDGKLVEPAVSSCSWAQRRLLALHRRSEREYRRDYDSERWLRAAENGYTEY